MMKDFYREEQMIEIAGHYDVIIAGGGIAGISAALAAKRNGCSVLLVEKSIILGGLATLGLVAIYLPLCDGKGSKKSAGIAEELLLRSIKYGYHNLPSDWADGKGGAGVSTRYRTDFNVAEFVLALDELMETEDIEILYDSVGSKLIMDGDVCKGLVIENKTGRRAYMGKVMIDTTGDLELMAKAGVSCSEGSNWLTYWAYTTDLEQMKKAVEAKDVYAGIRLHPFGARWNGENHPDEYGYYVGTTSEEITKFILDGRRLLRNTFKSTPSRDKAVIGLPGMSQLRTGRMLKGYYTLNDDDVNKHFADSIGCVTNFVSPGKVYEMPYRILITPEMQNVITAGRSFSATGDAWVFAKVIPGCAVSGEAAGIAASIAVHKDCSLVEVNVNDLQHKIAQAGGIIHF